LLHLLGDWTVVRGNGVAGVEYDLAIERGAVLLPSAL